MRASGCRTPPVRSKKTKPDAPLPSKQAPIPASDQLRVLPVTSLPNASSFPGNGRRKRSRCSRLGSAPSKWLLHPPGTKQFGASSQEKKKKKHPEMKDEPPPSSSKPPHLRHSWTPPARIHEQSGARKNNKKNPQKPVVSTSLARQKSSWAQLAAPKRLKSSEPFTPHAHFFFSFLFFGVSEADQRAWHDCGAPPTEHARPRRRRFVGVNRIKK